MVVKRDTDLTSRREGLTLNQYDFRLSVRSQIPTSVIQVCEALLPQCSLYYVSVSY